MSRAPDADSIIAPVPRVSIQAYCETPAMAGAVAVGLLVVYSQQAVHTQQAVTSAAQPLAPGIEWAWGYRVGSAIPAPKPT